MEMTIIYFLAMWALILLFIVADLSRKLDIQLTYTVKQKELISEQSKYIDILECKFSKNKKVDKIV